MSAAAVRTMPGTTPRNGLPETRGYVYRGTGEDIMPWAVTGDDSVAGEELTGIRAGRAARRWQPSPSRCVKCGYLYKSAKHHELCKGTGGRCSACGYRATSKNHRTLCGGTA